MAFKRRLSRRRQSEKGQAIIELTAAIIMFVIMIALVFSISLFLYVQHALVSAAREGARDASLDTNIGNSTTQAAGISEVQTYTVNSVRSLTGLTIDTTDVTVTPPDPAGVQGDRTVAVQINYNVTNPLPIAAFLQALGASGEGLDSFPIGASATMRYEE